MTSRPEDQLQLWDLRSGAKLRSVPWSGAATGMLSGDSTQLYAAKFGKGGAEHVIAAGGSGGNELKLFARATLKSLGVATLPRGVYCLDFSHAGGTIAVAGGDCVVRTYAVPGVHPGPAATGTAPEAAE